MAALKRFARNFDTNQQNKWQKDDERRKRKKISTPQIHHIKPFLIFKKKTKQKNIHTYIRGHGKSHSSHSLDIET